MEGLPCGERGINSEQHANQSRKRLAYRPSYTRKRRVGKAFKVCGFVKRGATFPVMNSPFAWPGGKRNLISTLRTHIPKHTIYVEVFSGSAKLLFAKEASATEILNDLNGELINFFRVVKHRAAELAELLEHEIIHPERFRDLRNETTLNELTRALRFAYTTWYSYGAKGEHFAAVTVKEALVGSMRRPIDSLRDLLEQTAERMRRVRIEQRDFADLVRRFDTPETFFYLDPPYVHYMPNGRYDALSAERREELFELLSKIQGTFLMSFDDCIEVRQLAERHSFIVEEVQTRYGLGSTADSRGKITELLVSGTR